MSKASEWAAACTASEQARLDALRRAHMPTWDDQYYSGGVGATVTRDGALEVCSRNLYSADTVRVRIEASKALSLANWILDTFGDA
jgi:hypothetical protein